MHVQVVNFNLNGIDEAEFTKACEEQFAPAFREVPGLLSKVWLRNAETNTYGGVYTWNDKEAMERFENSELFRSIATNPQFGNLRSSDFAVMEEPTRVTHGFVESMV